MDELAKQLGKLIEGFPVWMHPHWEDVFSANSFVIAYSLWVLVILVVMTAILFDRGYVRSLGHGIIILPLLAILADRWVAIFDWLAGFNHDLVQMAKFNVHNAGAGSIDHIPSWVDTLGSLAFLVFLVLAALALLMTFAFQTIALAFIKFAAPVAIVTYPLGGKWKKTTEWMLTGGIAGALFGQPVAMACISLSRIFANQFGKDSPVLLSIFLIVGLASATVVNWLLMSSTKEIVGRVIQKYGSNRLLGGDVDARIKRDHPIPVSNVNAANRGSMRIPNTASAVTVVATAVNPAVAKAATAVSVARSARQARRAQKPRDEEGS